MEREAVRLVTDRTRAFWPSLVRQMHEDRKRVFVDMLKWRLSHEDGIERDSFDDGQAEYLILHDPATGGHLASLRLLSTERPHLMSEIFPDLCEGGPPTGPGIREITRFCVAPRGRAADRRLARNRLVRSMVEYGLLTGIHSFTAACEMGFLSETLSAGWDCRPLGPPTYFDGKPIGAIRINIHPGTLATLNDSWSCDPVAIQYFEAQTPLAA